MLKPFASLAAPNAGNGLGGSSKGDNGVECVVEATRALGSSAFRDPAFPRERIAMQAGLSGSAAMASVARGVLQVRSKPDQHLPSEEKRRHKNKHTKGSNAATGTSEVKQPKDGDSGKEQAQSKQGTPGHNGTSDVNKRSLLEDVRAIVDKYRSPDAEELFNSLKEFMASKSAT